MDIIIVFICLQETEETYIIFNFGLGENLMK